MEFNAHSLNSHNKEYKNLFNGKSQMAGLMQSFDWSSHPLGNPEQWPLSLKTGLRIILHSAHPMFIWWSRELYMFHNDPYLPALGNKHPKALGARASDMWSEIWPQIGRIVEEILDGGDAFYAEELLIPLNRKGFMEETYWTFSYSPMFDDEGKVKGIFCACNEVTETVLAKRRLQAIRDIAETLGELPSVELICEAACKTLAKNSHDIPFGMLYLLDSAGTEARLIGQTTELPQEIAPPWVGLNQSDKPPKWPFDKVLQSRQAEIVALFEKEDVLNGYHTKLPDQAVVLPLFQPAVPQANGTEAGKDSFFGFFISGISPGLAYNTDYQHFHQLLTRHITGSIASIKSRAETEHQKARLERFFMQAPASICILDGPDLVYELVNPGYQKLFPGRKLLGRPILEALPEIADNAMYRTFKLVYETGITHEEQELLIPLARPKDGVLEDRYFKYIQQARHNEQGHIDGILVFAYEVTDLVQSRRRAEASEKRLQINSDELAATNEELNESNQQLMRLNIDLDNFIYTASHDLKAPILNIEGLLQVLLRSLPPDAMAEGRNLQITSMMQTSIDRFKRTIANLTEITKLQKENDPETTLVSIGEVVAEVLLDLQPLIDSTKTVVKTEVEGCASIRFSIKNLRSIIYNLLSNALKYHSPERTPLVQITCRQSEDSLVLSVQDNGLGMNLSDESKIFAMFKRLHTHVEGEGIGLYMVKKIIENAGGKIEVKSKAGEGSLFQVYFKL